MEVSRWIATLSLLLAVPVSIWLAYAGYQRDVYPYPAIPFAFGGIVLVSFGLLLFVVLPFLNSRGW